MVRWDALLILDLCFNVVDRIAGLDVKRDSLPREGLHENLHATTKAQHQVQSGLLLDVVIAKGPPVLELFPSEDQALLVRWDALLILDLCFNVVDRIAGLDVKRDRLPREGLHENL